MKPNTKLSEFLDRCGPWASDVERDAAEAEVILGGGMLVCLGKPDSSGYSNVLVFLNGSRRTVPGVTAFFGGNAQQSLVAWDPEESNMAICKAYVQTDDVLAFSKFVGQKVVGWCFR